MSELVEKIDLVYLWVNSNDPEWRKKKQKYDKSISECNSDSVSDCRFIDNDELKYSLRSVEKNLPWINKIYIVTDNQTPSWLNTDNEKIKIVDHSEIIPNDKLPLYNSCAIETRIPYIEGLSEHFVYANDDMLFWLPIEKSLFFKDGKPIYQAGKKILNKKYKHLYGYTIVRAYNLIKEKFKKNIPYFPHHNADPYRKSLCLECEKEFQEDYDNTLNNRFRDFSDIQRTIIMYYSIAKDGAILNRENNNIFTRLFNKSPQISLAYDTKPANINKIKKANCYLLCLNDSRKTTDKSREEAKKILEKKFPQKSSFEK